MMRERQVKRRTGRREYEGEDGKRKKRKEGLRG